MKKFSDAERALDALEKLPDLAARAETLIEVMREFVGTGVRGL